MEHIQTTKQKLVFEIEQLSHPYHMELQNFILYLKFKQSLTTATPHNHHVVQSVEDPLLRAFGLIDVPPYHEVKQLYQNIRRTRGTIITTGLLQNGLKPRKHYVSNFTINRIFHLQI